jgi:hypothetical protein
VGAAERVEVLAHERRRHGQGGVVDRVPLRAQLGDHPPHVARVPGDHRVVQHPQAAERAELVLEAPSPEGAFLAEEQEPGEVVRGLASVQLAALLPPVLLVMARDS